jgi:hypothetical protein
MSIKSLKNNPDFWVLVSIATLGLLGSIVFGLKSWPYMQFVSFSLLAISIGVGFFNQNINRAFYDIFLNKSQGNLKPVGTLRQRAFIRVQNSVNNGKVFVSSEPDGIYIRLAGNENEGEAYSETKVKVYDYER